MSKFLTGIAQHVPVLSKFLNPAPATKPLSWSSIVAAPRQALQRIVSRVPLHSKFIAFFVPEKLTLEYKAPDAHTLDAEASIIRAAASVTTPALKPRFNKPSGPSP